MLQLHLSLDMLLAPMPQKLQNTPIYQLKKSKQKVAKIATFCLLFLFINNFPVF